MPGGTTPKATAMPAVRQQGWTAEESDRQELMTEQAPSDADRFARPERLRQLRSRTSQSTAQSLLKSRGGNATLVDAVERRP